MTIRDLNVHNQDSLTREIINRGNLPLKKPVPVSKNQDQIKQLKKENKRLKKLFEDSQRKFNDYILETRSEKEKRNHMIKNLLPLLEKKRVQDKQGKRSASKKALKSGNSNRSPIRSQVEKIYLQKTLSKQPGDKFVGRINLLDLPFSKHEKIRHWQEVSALMKSETVNF